MSGVQTASATETVSINGATFSQAKSLAEGFNDVALNTLDIDEEEVVAGVLADAASFLADLAPSIKNGSTLDLIDMKRSKSSQCFDIFNMEVARAEAGRPVLRDSIHDIVVAEGVGKNLTSIRETFGLQSDIQAARVAVSLYTRVKQGEAQGGLKMQVITPR